MATLSEENQQRFISYPWLDFTSSIRHLAHQGIAKAVATVFKQANITVEVKGDTSCWSSSDRGTLLIGDHRNGLEYLPLLAALGDAARNNVHIVAKPFSMQARLLGSLGTEGTNMTLAVIPRTLARDRKDIFSYIARAPAYCLKAFQ
jgi:hypothetical protein